MFGRKDRKTPFVQEPDEELEALRDDCIALFLNSGLTREEVHKRGGPTSTTLGKWLYKETLFPRLATIQSLVRALGYKLAVTDRGADETEALRTAKIIHKNNRPVVVNRMPARREQPRLH